MKRGVLIPNTGGLVAATAVANGDLVHTLSANRGFAKIRKIMFSNYSGAAVTLTFGTRDLAAAPAFVPLLPTINALNGFHDAIGEDLIPDVLWRRLGLALAAGRDGNIYVLSSAIAIAGSVVVACTIEER